MELNENSKFSILVVDDNTKNIQVIGNILKESGYSVGFALDGRQALTQLDKSNDYDLILLDIEMPEMDGYETCRLIKQNKAFRDIPVIFLTAYIDPTNIVKGFDVGAQDYITKPFNSKELLARVNTHLQLKHKSDLIRQLNAELEEKVAERTAALQKAYDTLNNLDHMKTDFLVLISQQIRTPLDAVVGTLNLIKNEEHSTAIRQLLESLNTSVSNLENYTYKALLFSQLSHKKYRIKINPLNLRELVQFAVLEMSSTIREKQVEVTIREVPAPVFVRADRDLLFKALVYILENALSFSPENKPVEISFHEEETQIECAISDQGPGFSKESITRLEQPVLLNHDSDTQSTGLSLYIVKQIVDLHDGSVYLKNNENGGAIVELVFKK